MLKMENINIEEGGGYFLLQKADLRMNDLKPSN